MVASQTSGELPLTRPIITAFCCTNSLPNRISPIRTASSARDGWVTGPMNDLSECLIAE